MGKPAKLPEGVRPVAQVILVGLLAEQGRLVPLAGRDTELCRVWIKAGDVRVGVLGSGPMAAELARLAVGTPVRLEGELFFHRWTTGEGKARERLEVKAVGVKEL